MVRRRVTWALLVSFLVGAALVAVVVAVPMLSRFSGAVNETVAAFALLKFLVAVPVGAILGGWSLRWIGDGVVSALGMLITAVSLCFAAAWERGALDTGQGTITLASIGLGIGLAIAPVNNAALADAPPDTRGTAASLVVVSRMTGMVVGLSVLMAIGLNRYFAAVAQLPDRTNVDALLDAAITQVQTILLGAAIAAFLAAAASVALGLGRFRNAHATRSS